MVTLFPPLTGLADIAHAGAAGFRSLSTGWRQARHITCIAAAVLAWVNPGVASADTDYEPPTVLRVCQDPNNLPFSNEQQEGIENRLAELFGEKLGVPVEYFSFPQRLAFVRNTIRYRLPGEDYRCDIMMGVPERFGQVSTTSAYYRSTYALVYRKGGPLDGVSNSAEFIERARTALKPERLGIHDKSPASAYLDKYSLTQVARLYPTMSPDPESYPGQLIERDLVDGVIDAAIVWGPVAGYYGNRIEEPELVVVPLVSEPGVRFDFSIAMGVRYGEPQWKGVVQRFLDEARPEIMAILREFNVPLVDELGNLIPTDSDPEVAGAAAAAAPGARAGTLQPEAGNRELKAERDIQSNAADAADAAASQREAEARAAGATSAGAIIRSKAAFVAG